MLRTNSKASSGKVFEARDVVLCIASAEMATDSITKIFFELIAKNSNDTEKR